MPWRSALRADCTAMLGLGSRRRTHCAHFVRCVQTDVGESEDEARSRAPTPGLRFSSPQKSPLPGTVCRECHHCAARARSAARASREAAGFMRRGWRNAPWATEMKLERCTKHPVRAEPGSPTSPEVSKEALFEDHADPSTRGLRQAQSPAQGERLFMHRGCRSAPWED